MRIKVLGNTYLMDQEETQWCWVSCFQGLFKAFYNEDIRQCKLAAFLPENKNKDCCSDRLECNYPIHKSDLTDVFAKKEVLLKKAHDKINDYDFIIHHLKSKKSPLLLWVVAETTNHLVLITGYAQDKQEKTCKFLTIYNPTGTEEFVKHNRPFKFLQWKAKLMWTTEPSISASSLVFEDYEPKSILPSGYITFENRVFIQNRLFPNWFLKLNMRLPKPYLPTYPYLVAVPREVEFRKEVISFEEDFRSNLCKDNIFKFNDIVRTKINQKLLELDSFGGNKIGYLRPYGMVYIICNKGSVHIVNAPKNYALKSKYDTYSEFVKTLKNKKPINSLINN